MKKITLLIAFMLFIISMGYGQTVLISPTGDGGFQNGNTFASNGWTIANSANNPWVVGTVAATGTMTGNVAYVSNTSGTTHAYDTGTIATNFFYRDITVPAGQTKINLSLNWYGSGESTWDLWQVFVAPTSVTPVGVVSHPGNGAAVIPPGIAGAQYLGGGNQQTTVQTATYQLPGNLAGTTFRLIFSWKNDGGGGTQPPAAIDNISLTSAAGGDFVSVASGNWSAPATWNLNAVPNFTETSVTIAAGHTVTVDATGLSAPATTVNGTLAYGTTPTTFPITGNLTINSGGAVNVFNGTTGKTLSVAGNIVNNGTLNVSVGSTSAGTLTLNGLGVQSVSGTGTFTNNVIRNLIFNNGNNVFPNINWQVNNISVDYNLDVTNARINLGTNKLTYGTSATSSGSTFTTTNGGFMPGGKFARWYSSSGAGYTTSGPTTVPSGGPGRYPFFTPQGQQRIFYLGRTTPSAGGIYAVTYNHVAGITTGLSIADGAYTVTDRLNGNFTVTTEGTTPAEATNWVTIFAPDIYIPANGNGRVISQSAAISGTHVATGGVSSAQRSGVTQADLTNPNGLYLGINTNDIAFSAIASGNWNAASTWNKGVVPTCNDLIVIPSGFNVTVNSAGNVTKGITINSGGTLTVASGDLVIGCTLYNNTLTNNGTLTITGGTLNLNGNFLMNNGGSFNQSAGNFNVDGNANGDVAISVASGTPIFRIGTSALSYSSGTVALTGGTITIVDPHTATSSSSGYALAVHLPSSYNIEVGTGHTFRFGDGVSVDPGGHASGFYVDPYVSNGRLNFGNVIINNPSGSNRNVVHPFASGIHGNLSVIAGNYAPTAGLTVRGNISVTGGQYVTGSLTLATPSGTGSAVNTGAQSIGFTAPGVIKNLPTGETANFTSLTVNNSNATGVTLSNPFSVSGTLTLTSGKVNTTATNLLTLGTATAAGTLSGGSATAYIAGPFVRNIASGNTATGYILFPVGKAAYAPVSIAPVTTTATVMKAEAFDTNTGTFDASLLDLATNRRWEVPVVSGTVTSLRVRLGDANLTSVNIPVQAPGAAGVYTNTFGSTAIFATATPNTVTANAALPIASYTGFLSYAKSNTCLGVPAPGNTIASTNNICIGARVALSVQNTIPGSGLTYQWQSSTDGVTYNDIAGATITTYSAVPLVVTTYRLKVTCSSGPDIGYSTPVQITFTNTASNPVSAGRCGPGNVVLAATPSTGADVTWFDSVTSGSVVGTGASFTTPAIAATTKYYASASVTSPSGVKAVGAGATTSATYSNPFYSLYSNNHTQHIITVQELNNAGITTGNISSIALDVTSAGSLPMIDLSIKIGTTTANDMSAFVNNAGFTTVYTSASLMPVVGINTFTFSTPFNWDGTSNIVLEFCHGNGSSTSTMSRTVKADTTTYLSSIKTHSTNQTNAGTICGDIVTNNTTYSLRPQFLFNHTPVCYSPRIEVTATVNPSPAFALSSAERNICIGATSEPVTIATGAADYNAYTWSPSTGVSGNATTGWSFNPTTTTTYTLSATNGTCNSVPVTVVVNVSALPSTVTLADATYCEGTGSVRLAPFGGTNASVILSENFNGATNNWTTVNNSTGGTVANAAWTLRANNYVSSSDTFRSNDNSQFYLSNSGSQSGVTETILTSPAFNTTTFESVTVSFYHHLKETSSGSSRAAIEFSSNGTDWLESNVFEATVGTTTGFVLGTAVVPPTMMNKPSVYVRFKYNANSRFFWAIDNVIISGQKNPGYTWSPAAGLYTNAAGTTPYVAGTVAPIVYAKPTANTTYTITATNATGCVTTGTVSVSLSSTPAPQVASSTLSICKSGTVADLTATGTGIKWYTQETGGNSLFIATPLVNGTYYATQTIGGCESFLRTPVTVTIITVDAPTVPAATQSICSSGTVADLDVTGNGIKWYADATGGTALEATTALQDGVTYYASQSEGTCESTERVSVTVSLTINNAPVIDEPSQTFCNSGTVADLTVTGTDVKWYTQETGGVAVEESTALVSGTYYASQTIDGCESALRTAKTVVVNIIVAPTGDNEQEFCTSATLAQLTATGTDVKWYSEATGGTLLTTDTALVNDTTYFASQTINECESPLRLAVNVLIYNTVADAPENVTVCNEYILPVLENGNYFTQPNGAGTQVAAGTAVNQTTTFYVYAQQGTDIVCSAQDSFTVSVNFVPAPTGNSTQTINGGVEGDATIEDIQIVQIIGATVVWYPTEEDALAGTNPIAPGTELVQGSTYYATQTIGTCTSATALAVTVDIVLGKDDFDSKAFSYHPNPVTDILNISYSSEITSVTVFNLLGQQVISRQPNATEVKIDMSTLADAPYIVNVTAGNTVKTIKVIKKQ